MDSEKILDGTVHKTPSDFAHELIPRKDSLHAWNDITPLARNEWICWIESVKRPETRESHIRRAYTELAEGKRRPCCWPGCAHRQKNGL